MVSHTTRLVCYAIPRCPGPSHPDTKVRYTGDNDTLSIYLSIYTICPPLCGGSALPPTHGARRASVAGTTGRRHAAAAQRRRVPPASLLQAHLQVRRSTRCLGQLYKSGFTELCDVIMRTNETPLAAATHKLNQLKDKAGLSDAPADDSGRPRGRICG